MTTSARVVPTALAASPSAPLPLEAAVPLLTDEQGRLLVNVATSVFPPPVPPPTPVPAQKGIADLVAGEASPVLGIGTLQRVTISIYSGAGFLFILDGIDSTGTLLCTPIPIPTTLPAYIDAEFDTVNGLSFSTGVAVAVSTTAPAVAVDVTATGTVTAFITT